MSFDKQIETIKSRVGGKQFLPLLAFPLALLWMEAVLKIWDFGTFWDRGLLYTALFSFAIGVFLSAFCAFGRLRTNRIVSVVLMAAVTVFYMVQAVYFTVMQTVFAVYSVSVATNATEFWKVGVSGTWRTLPALLAMLVPLALLCVFGKRITPAQPIVGKRMLALLLLALLLYGVAVAAVFFSKSGILSPWEIYSSKSNPELSVSHFGVLTSLRLDVKRMLFPEKELDGVPSFAPDPLESNEIEMVYPANVLNIDFAALAKTEQDDEQKEMHSYFAARTPSMKNEYTGKFAGKNLIMLTAEAFSSWAVDAEITPTLYRLSTKGFVFKNFYTPLWWVSTSDGEYFSCTSLIPKSGKQSFAESIGNSLPFCMGNQLRGLGYTTKAYHDHTYTYYQRDKTHPNMGYDFQGLGNGLEVKPTWPESDLDMMQQTIPDYIGSALPFHAYYMTVSGHLQYSFADNQMASKNRDKVSHLPLSEEAQAYMACQIELDRALEYLLQQLEAAGELENTVICLYPDHYPYGLSDNALEELGGEGIKDSLELYRSTMILWSGDMKAPVEIEKPCSNLDILPTLSNLFALEFDSRLLMGRDILSSDPGLVMFSDNSYITELGSYIATKDSFIPALGAVVPKGYARDMLQTVQDKFLYSGKILMTDYYRKIGLEPAATPASGG